MSLFQCEQCGCCENTALSNYWVRKADKQAVLCSACDPAIGEWHGRFERVFLPLGEFKTNSVGNLEHVATGSEDFRAFATPQQDHPPMTAKPCKKCARLIYAGIAHTCPDTNCYYHVPVATPKPPMTAPDDVRVRFGFTISDSEPRILTWDGDNGCRPATDAEIALWDAHADLSGEVRELVEAVEYMSDYFHRDSAVPQVVQLRAALAKFTHQEEL